MPVTEDNLYRAIKNGSFENDEFIKDGVPAPALSTL